jgi:uncharacterized membrane protein YhaH (DUF805 family)
MTIFGDFRLGRIGYAIVLILMFGFDFAKTPILSFIMALHDQAANELMKPRIVKNPTPSETGKINGRPMPLMLKSQEDMFRSIVNSGESPSKEELTRRFLSATGTSLLTMETNHPASQEVRRLEETRSFFAVLFPVAVIAMTGITIVGLLWMVSSRLRDIGWPQYVLWVLLTPVFLPKFVGFSLSAEAAHGISLFFYTGLFVLAFIPCRDAARPPGHGNIPLAPIQVRRRPGQFGRLGTR